LFNVKTLIYSEAQRIASDQFWSTLYSVSTVSIRSVTQGTVCGVYYGVSYLS